MGKEQDLKGGLLVLPYFWLQMPMLGVWLAWRKVIFHVAVPYAVHSPQELIMSVKTSSKP